MEPGTSKWRRERPESCDDSSKGGELKKPISLGHPGSLKKGKTPPVAVTSPITHTAQSALKVAGKPEGKATDKGKLAVKNTGLQRSSSDAGRDRLSDAKKPPRALLAPLLQDPLVIRSSPLLPAQPLSCRPVAQPLSARSRSPQGSLSSH